MKFVAILREKFGRQVGGKMETLAGILWTVIGIFLIVAEIFTAGFVLLWFGVGALAAAFAAILGFGVGFQFLIFALVSIVLTALSRTLFVNYFSRGDELKSGVDSLPGQIGTVIASSQGAMRGGEVKVFGSTWTAYPVDGEKLLTAGERVEVVRVAGASIYVRSVDALPEWRKQTTFKAENEIEN